MRRDTSASCSRDSSSGRPDVSALERGFSAQANWAPCAGRRLEHERAAQTHYALLLRAAPLKVSELPELNRLCGGTSRGTAEVEPRIASGPGRRGEPVVLDEQGAGRSKRRGVLYCRDAPIRYRDLVRNQFLNKNGSKHRSFPFCVILCI